MSSGVTLEEDVLDRYQKDFKMSNTQQFNFQVYAFTPDRKRIRIEHEGKDEKELVRTLKRFRDEKRGCYIAYHQPTTKTDGTLSGTKVKLTLYSDDDHTTALDRLLTASSFDALKKKLDGVQLERQLHSLDDVLDDFGICDSD